MTAPAHVAVAVSLHRERLAARAAQARAEATTLVAAAKRAAAEARTSHALFAAGEQLQAAARAAHTAEAAEATLDRYK